MRTNSKLVLSVGLAAATLVLVLANTVSGMVLRTGLVPVLGLGAIAPAVGSICFVMEAKVISGSRFAGCKRNYRHDTWFDSYRVPSSHRVPGPNLRSHLRARYNRAWGGRGHNNDKDRNFSCGHQVNFLICQRQTAKNALIVWGINEYVLSSK